ncbi:MAG TPA: DUF411 domain-containing protein [Stellaceae bacterium]|nr:DUF411 domain-containing protein [Stellaceae bacterium]
MITRRALLLSAPLLALAPTAHANGVAVTLYRDPGCGCCDNYVSYLRRHGFDVTTKSASPDEVSAMSRKAGIPSDLEGCHIAFIQGYAVGGLVPVAAVQKLLKDHPPLKAITLAGMPTGAPGMMGAKEGKLTVFAIPKEGNPSVFMTF